jgi:hypothetical protein
MAVQYAFSQITTQGLRLAVDAADPLSYPGSGTVLTDVSGNGFTGNVSSSISFAVTNRGALFSPNSSSAITFSGLAADFGTGSFTMEMAFTPQTINGQHFLYSKNSGSFPNFGAFLTGSNGSGRLVAFYNISSTISCSASTPTGSFVTGSNYIVDVTYVPSQLATFIYTNSSITAQAGANGTGSLSTSASLFLLNNSTSSNAGSVANLYNFKVYNPNLGLSFIRKNYNAQAARFGLPLATYIPPAPLLLDQYAGAAAAYSLRKLRELYSGAAIRVRRSSDNTEADIGFDGDGNLNTGALLSFCEAGNGFVTTWYDQSGNGYDATKTTAVNQPQIVSSGSIITDNSKPSILFDGTNDFLGFTDTAYNNYSIYGVYSNATFAAIQVLLGKFLADYLAVTNITTVTTNPGGANNGYGGVINTQTLLTANRDTANNVKVYKNNTIFGSTYNNNVALDLSFIGQANDIWWWNGKISEIVLYQSDKTSSITGINTNINTYYAIY